MIVSRRLVRTHGTQWDGLLEGVAGGWAEAFPLPELPSAVPATVEPVMEQAAQQAPSEATPAKLFEAPCDRASCF